MISNKKTNFKRGLNNMETTNIKLKKLMQTALLAALCYVSFTFLQIKITKEYCKLFKAPLRLILCHICFQLVKRITNAVKTHSIGRGYAFPSHYFDNSTPTNNITTS